MGCFKKAALLFFISVSAVSGIDFNARATPFAVIPVGDSSSLYSLGGGAFVNSNIEFREMFMAGPEIGFFSSPLLNTGTSASAVTAGAAAGVFLYPYSRIALLANTSFGIYQFKYDEFSYSDIWWKIFAEAGFRFSPTLIVSAGAGYINLNSSGGPMYSGIITGISGKMSFQTEASPGNIDYSLDQPEPVFPLLYSIYRQNSIGTLTITNNESAEIRNVGIEFSTENYTASAISCGTAGILRKNQSADFPLYADFSQSIQNFTESGMIPGELTITYDLLGEKRVTKKTLIIPVHNRNTMRWTDPSIVASFISPNSSEVMDYSKYIVGIARNQLRSGLNRNMQFAMYLYNGLRAGGISYSADDTTPYTEFHKDPALQDYIQYPFQTLSYRLGDYDDLGILYAASLESVGIKSAIVPLEEDFLVAFLLDITPEQAETLFTNTDRLLTVGNEIWLPLSFSVLREGFINSWYRAVELISENIGKGRNIIFIALQDAWKTYPPSDARGQEAAFQKPNEQSVINSVETEMTRYVASEFGPKIRAAQEKIDNTGGSEQLYNQLGLLYVRAGMYNEAREEFYKSSVLGSVTAMINIGNIEMLEKNYREAETWFRRAIDIQPDNSSALNGLDRITALLEE